MSGDTRVFLGPYVEVMTDYNRVVSPIRVAHRLIAEVFFSVYGEMDNGEKMPSPGPGGLRVMRITRAVAVPSVSHANMDVIQRAKTHPY